MLSYLTLFNTMESTPEQFISIVILLPFQSPRHQTVHQSSSKLRHELQHLPSSFSCLTPMNYAIFPVLPTLKKEGKKRGKGKRKWTRGMNFCLPSQFVISPVQWHIIVVLKRCNLGIISTEIFSLMFLLDAWLPALGNILICFVFTLESSPCHKTLSMGHFRYLEAS